MHPIAKTIEATPAAYQAWRNAIVQIGPNLVPLHARGVFGRLRLVEPVFADIQAGAPLPAVLYLHDCAGLKIEAMRDIDEISAAGFAVFAPDSFDNRSRKSDCIRFDLRSRLSKL